MQKSLDKKLLGVTSVFIGVFLFLTLFSGALPMFLATVFFAALFVAQILEAKTGRDWIWKTMIATVVAFVYFMLVETSIREVIFTLLIGAFFYATAFLTEWHLQKS